MEIIKKFKEALEGKFDDEFSHNYNSIMLELGEYENKIWTEDTLAEDVNEGMFNVEWNVTYHLIHDDVKGNKAFIGEEGYGFYDLDRDEAEEALFGTLEEYDEQKLINVFEWLF